MIEDSKFTDSVWQQMTADEQFELATRRLSGSILDDGEGGYMVMMGSQSFKRITDYEKEMVEKYGREKDINHKA